MQGEKTIYDKPIYQILQYLYSILLSNIYFLASNILILIYSIMVTIDPQIFNVFTFMMLLIPAGPAITALCSTMMKLIRERECAITKEYFTSYREKFKQSITLSIMLVIGAFICLLDYRFFISNGNLLGVVFGVGAIYILVISLYIFPIISSIELGKKKVCILSFYYSIKRLPITLIKLALICMVFFISSSINIVSGTFLFSLTCYLIMLCDNKIILELENSLEKK